jgi:hypothetical protein
MWREFREKKNPFTGNGKILTKSEWTKLFYHCQKFRNSPCLASGSRPSLVHTFESYMTQKIREWEVQNFITTNTLTRYATTYPSSRNKVDCGTPSNLNCNNTRKLEAQENEIIVSDSRNLCGSWFSSSLTNTYLILYKPCVTNNAPPPSISIWYWI